MTCKFCNKELKRKSYEASTTFSKRKTCGRECAILYRKTNHLGFFAGVRNV